MNDATDLVQVKISIKNCSIPVWRRAIVPTAYTLFDLHNVIQAAIGWTDSHLSGFFIGTTMYVDKKIQVDDMNEDNEDERSVVVRTILNKLPKQIMYTYDFGDSWNHEIKFERFITPKAGVIYPTCVGGSGACPPEDVGGVGGYDTFLEAVKYPKRKANREILEWYGYGDEHELQFNPISFDIDTANMELREYYIKYKQKNVSK